MKTIKVTDKAYEIIERLTKKPLTNEENMNSIVALVVTSNVFDDELYSLVCDLANLNRELNKSSDNGELKNLVEEYDSMPADKKYNVIKSLLDEFDGDAGKALEAIGKTSF